jgi:hypothetical protein
MIEYLPIVLTGVGIMASILYYASVLRNANKTQIMQLETRQTQLFMDLKKQLDAPAFLETYFKVMNTYHWKDYADYMENFGPTKHPDKAAEIYSLVNFFHGIGVLLALDRIDINLVGMHLGSRVVELWNKMESIIFERRRSENMPYLLVYLEFMKDEQLKRESYPRGKASYLAK